ncbi:MAG TPA: hypothetical protein DEB39_07905 [Planctomycetaceae bacterium]|nr:hypothetical protein [Planctomycetaceae bacterium]
MRKILILSVCLFFVCTLAFAAWLFGKKEAPVPNIQAIRETLKSLAPTETEGAAISKFRQKALAVYHASPAPGISEESRNRFQAGYSMPESAEPVDLDDDSVQISIEFRLLAAKEAFGKRILTDKAMCWSGVPVPQLTLSQANGTAPTPGQCSVSTDMRIPLQVRFMAEEKAFKFMKLFQSSPVSHILQAPKVTIFNGQTANVRDCTQTPFVTSVLTVEGETATAYQPVIQIVDEGIDITMQGTLLKDDSCRLHAHMEFRKIKDVQVVRLVEEEPETTAKKKAGASSTGGISLQSPSVHRLAIAIPEIDIPKNMSLLVAMPGVTYDDEMVFVLITPRRVDPVEEISVEATDTQAMPAVAQPGR